MQIGTFLFGTLIATLATTVAAIMAGVSIWAAFGFGALTAFVAQMLYLALITALMLRETDGRRAPDRVRSSDAKADQKSIGTAQP